MSATVFIIRDMQCKSIAALNFITIMRQCHLVKESDLKEKFERGDKLLNPEGINNKTSRFWMLLKIF